MAGGLPCSVRRAGRETSPCIAGSWFKTLSPSDPLPLSGQCPCRGAGWALMGRAGHGGAQRSRGSAAAAPCAAWHRTLLRWGPQPASRLPRQLHTAHGLSPREGRVQVRAESPGLRGGGSERQAEGLAECVPTLRSPSVHVGADRAGDAERLGGDGDVLVVHGAVVVRGDVGV